MALAFGAGLLILSACGGGSSESAEAEGDGSDVQRDALPTDDGSGSTHLPGDPGDATGLPGDDSSGSGELPGGGSGDDSGLPTEDNDGSDNPDVSVAPPSSSTTTSTTTTTTTIPAPPPAPPPCRLEDEALFATNRWELRDTRPLRVLAATIERQADNPRLRITGHTDSRGSREDNLVLSQRRAESVRTWFVNNGVPPSRITARGAGESRLLVPDHDAAGNFIEPAGARNRRVEVRVYSRQAIDC